MKPLLALLLAAGTFCAGLGAATLPRPAGPIEFISHTGQPVKLADLKGQVVVIEFLLTHCPTCKNNARLLSSLHTEFAPDGLAVIGLAIDAGAGPKLIPFVRETNSNFPIGLMDENAARDFLQVPSVIRMMMPQLAIVDRRGNIREQHSAQEPWMADTVEEKNLRDVIRKLLKEGVPARKPAPKPAPAGK